MALRKCEIVVLSRFPEIFEGFRESVDRDAPELRKLVVWDSSTRWKDQPSCPIPWTHVMTLFPFQMAKNANHGFSRIHADSDILYCGDDTRIIEPNTIQRLQELAYSDPEIGILSARIQGTCCVGTPLAVTPEVQFVTYVGFVFIYIKREVIEKVGYLDERFKGYGTEDLEYCYRVRKAGFKIGVAVHIPVKHGVQGHTYGSTFIKVRGEQQMGRDDQENRRRFAEKYGIPNDAAAILEFIDKCE